MNKKSINNKYQTLTTFVTEFSFKKSIIRALSTLAILFLITACSDEKSDTNPPVIIINGGCRITVDYITVDYITVEYNTKNYTLPKAGAVDLEDDLLTVVVEGSVDTLTLGTYIITYTTTDYSGNSTVVECPIMVVDTTAPKITLIGNDTIDLLPNNSYTDLGATAYDKYDGDVIVTQTNDIDTSVIGSYTVTYKAIDSSGNERLATRNVNVLVPTPFVTTWTTTSPNEEITIPTGSYNYKFSIDWGDGSEVDENKTDSVTHIYDEAGTYTVSIIGIFPHMNNLNNDDIDKLTSVEQWGNIQWRSMAYMFKSAINLVINATDIPVLIYVEDMSHMFEGAVAFDHPLNGWDVSTVTDMSSMFSGATTFNQPLNDWDLSTVTDMSSMFSGASAFNQPIHDWDVSRVTDMSSMFSGASAFNEWLNNWDVSNVTDMSSMFAGATIFSQELNRWDVSNVMDMSSMFSGATAFGSSLGDWDVSNVKDMGNMFSNSELSTYYYDALLNAWSAQILQTKVEFGADGIYYSSASEAARQSIIDTYNWEINDGGLQP
ncbi:hypothetical protein GCM10008107_04120 [Psychrosphaera saromensis]|uniref:PKD domain-containing protein n=1 Tax=Psychrosphaera saromensis TaxID=716813 RepID=A0A2S7UXC5_9GAMM|nr:BspA family leucine-rich repeat surface protein [Psychrosphaera saromensis]PQJ54646.1 hypothetical protein BTO11_13985 [Psychrosphaera saromensis]GHB58329.1 hypothetical protein GCM10008107_04120 [Psychrosphaera saromensis]GLQ14133.1 hypothetical protein GCM10007917_15880 [Psychrosphaera saromensis]